MLDNPDMHPSVLRLLNFAREKTAETSAPIKSTTDLRKALGVTPATFSNWLKRGVSKEGAIEAESILGCPSSYTLSGDGPINMGVSPSLPALTNVRFPPQDRQPGLVFSWDEVIRMFKAGVEDHLPDVFSVELTDDALPGRARKGDIVTLCRSKRETVEAGDGVLVKTESGHYMLRIYRPKGDGTFTVEATNPNFQPLHSVADGLTVLAVVVGVPSLRWSSL